MIIIHDIIILIILIMAVVGCLQRGFYTTSYELAAKVMQPHQLDSQANAEMSHNESRRVKNETKLAVTNVI